MAKRMLLRNPIVRMCSLCIGTSARSESSQVWTPSGAWHSCEESAKHPLTIRAAVV